MLDRSDYDGWLFEDLVFAERFEVTTGPAGPDEVPATTLVPKTGVGISLSYVRNVRFVRCEFRGVPVYLQASRDVHFIDCDFVGVEPPGSPWRSTGRYVGGLRLGGGNENVVVERCRFHFCGDGLSSSRGSGPTIGVRVIDCRFRGEWWNGPYVRATLGVSASSFDATSRTLYVANDLKKVWEAEFGPGRRPRPSSCRSRW
jgi:hypothetical protein